MAGEAIFIGYRRDDTADVAGRMYDALGQRFGKQRIFMDVDNIGPGVDFGDYIKTVLPKCRVALMLIGPQWLDSKDEIGKRRIDDDHDWVRIEIETALATPSLLVVPVLVNGARMPRSEEVPESVRALLRRNAAQIRRNPDFHDDLERLATALRASVNTGVFDFSKIGEERKTSPATQAKRRGSPWLIGGVMVTLAAALFVWQPWRDVGGVAQSPLSQTGTSETSTETTAGASPFDLAALTADVRAAVESARSSMARAEERAVSARVAAQRAQVAANRTGATYWDAFLEQYGEYHGDDTTGTTFYGVVTVAASDTYWRNEAGNSWAGRWLVADDTLQSGVVTYGANVGIGARLARVEGQFGGQYPSLRAVGPCIVVLRNGDRYSGDLRGGEFSGFGVYVWADGSKYEGSWAHNERNGLGVLWGSSGRMISTGMWINGSLRSSSPQ